MECLQSQPAIVLFDLLSTMKKKETPFNQILRINLMHVINEKAPEIHMNPFIVYYRMKSENSDNFGTMNLNETRMDFPGLKYVLKQIFFSPINAERIEAVQKLHSIIIQRDSSQDRHVKGWIREANAARGETCGSLIYLAFDEVIQEAVVVGQEAGEAVIKNISESEATINASVAKTTQ